MNRAAASKKLLSHDSKHGAYAAKVMGLTPAYASSLVGEVSDQADAIDEAMRLGYNWKFGPFELIDQLGSAWLVEHLQKAGVAVPKFLSLASGKAIYRIEMASAKCWALMGLIMT